MNPEPCSPTPWVQLLSQTLNDFNQEAKLVALGAHWQITMPVISQQIQILLLIINVLCKWKQSAPIEG